MTRILVCGLAGEDFVNRSLDEVNLVYGPVSCVIHNNHLQALTWQQDVSEVQVTRHLPVEESPKIQVKELRWSEHRDRMFALGRPDYLVVFQTQGKDGTVEADEKTQQIAYRAQKDGIEVLTFTEVLRVKRRRRAAAETIAPEEPSQELAAS